MTGYVSPDWVSAIKDAALLLGFIVAVVGALAAVGRVLIVKPLKRMIADATYQIQPKANGGYSLADLHKKVDDIAVRLTRVEREMLRIDEELDDIVSN